MRRPAATILKCREKLTHQAIATLNGYCLDMLTYRKNSPIKRRLPQRKRHPARLYPHASYAATLQEPLHLRVNQARVAHSVYPSSSPIICAANACTAINTPPCRRVLAVSCLEMLSALTALWG
jgi:hypothetical protein